MKKFILYISFLFAAFNAVAQAPADEQQMNPKKDEKIKALPEQHRLMIVMRDIQNLSYEEIAEVMNLSLGTVKSRIARAREKLILDLTDYFKEVKADVS